MRLRIMLARFFQCSPVHLREMTMAELRASIDLAEEIAREQQKGESRGR